jgi:prevent-host-death family protein
MNITSETKRADRRARSAPALPMVSASELKNHFGDVSARAMKGAIAITRHSRAEFVLLPMEEYLDMQRARTTHLADLAAQFDVMAAKMNEPAAKRGVAKLFKAGSAELGKAAVKAAKAHGR